MTSSPAPDAPVHPILGFTRALAGALEDRVHVQEPAFLTVEEKRTVLVELARQRARLDGLELKVLAAADRDDVGAEMGATSTGAWLSHVTLVDRPEAAAKVKLARAFDDERALTAAGLAAGDYSTAHAAVITSAIADLPTDLEPDLVARAEKTLVEEAHHLTPKQLRQVGRHLLEVVAPDVVEAEERDRLDRADAAAFASARLSMRSLGDGTTQGWFRLPDLHAGLLKTAVEAVIAPRKTRSKSTKPAPDPVTGTMPDHPTRMGQGFCEILEHLPTDEYGEHGGLAATLVVTLDHEVLSTGLGAAALVYGTPVSPGEARRLACGAGIIPAVLGGTSAVLDLGREQRLFNRAQRIAMALRDKGCRAEGCDRPPSWTEAHHLTRPWAEGGPHRPRRRHPALRPPPPPRPPLQLHPSTTPQRRPPLPPQDVTCACARVDGDPHGCPPMRGRPSSWSRDQPRRTARGRAEFPGFAQRGSGFGPVAVTSRWGTQSST
jgi:hypothetical protein